MFVAATPHGDAPAPVHSMTTEALLREYVSLRSVGYSLTAEEAHLLDKIEALRKESTQAVMKAEIQEEQMSNRLFRRLDLLQKDVQHYQAVLKEEEGEVASLRKRISETRSQGNEIENILEEKQEYLLMDRQRKLVEMARKMTAMEQDLMIERQKYLDLLVTRLNVLRGHTGSFNTDGGASTKKGAETERPFTHAAGSTIPAVALTSVSTVPSPEGQRSQSAETLPGAPSYSAGSSPPIPIATGPFADAGGTPKEGFSATPSQNPGVTSSVAAVSKSATPRTPELASCSSHSSETHHAVVVLERKLNQLLVEQAAAIQRAATTEKQCAELTAKLHTVQEATFLDRARASKLKEELMEARARLGELETASGGGLAGNSFDDASLAGGKNSMIDQGGPLGASGLSLRERTRELLSSVPPPSQN